MRFIKSLRIGIAIVILLNNPIMAREDSDAYDFPIKPGTPEWKALTTHEQMREVLQVPEDILKDMSTKALVQTCLNYPLYGDIWACNSLQEGFEGVTAGFNGLQELLKRKDAGVELVKRYKEMDIKAFSQRWTLLQKGKHTAEFRHIEILLAQDAILTNLTKDERVLLLAESVQKFQSMLQAGIYGIMNVETNTLLIGRIMLKENYNTFTQKVAGNKKLNRFLKKAVVLDVESMNEIVSCAKQYINENR